MITLENTELVLQLQAYELFENHPKIIGVLWKFEHQYNCARTHMLLFLCKHNSFQIFMFIFGGMYEFEEYFLLKRAERQSQWTGYWIQNNVVFDWLDNACCLGSSPL